MRMQPLPFALLAKLDAAKDDANSAALMMGIDFAALKLSVVCITPVI